MFSFILFSNLEGYFCLIKNFFNVILSICWPWKDVYFSLNFIKELSWLPSSSKILISYIMKFFGPLQFLTLLFSCRIHMCYIVPHLKKSIRLIYTWKDWRNFYHQTIFLCPPLDFGIIINNCLITSYQKRWSDKI